MSLHPATDRLALDRLDPTDLIETFGYLDRDPVTNVYLLALVLRDALAQPRDEFWAARRGGEILGLLHIGSQSGAVLPVGDDPATLATLAEQVLARRATIPRRFQVIGRRAAVEAVVELLREHGIRPRLNRVQCYLALDRGGVPGFPRLHDLRVAEARDYDLVYRTGAELRAEELGEDPRVADPAAYAKRVEDECRDGYTFLWTRGEDLRFRASISARTPEAAQISGVFVPAELRGQGYARRGLSELCVRLLERSRSVCLFVNDFNAPALRVYDRVGFKHRADWASAFYDTR